MLCGELRLRIATLTSYRERGVDAEDDTESPTLFVNVLDTFV
jgi:hypothetical protein